MHAHVQTHVCPSAATRTFSTLLCSCELFVGDRILTILGIMCDCLDDCSISAPFVTLQHCQSQSVPIHQLFIVVACCCFFSPLPPSLFFVHLLALLTIICFVIQTQERHCCAHANNNSPERGESR